MDDDIGVYADSEFFSADRDHRMEQIMSEVMQRYTERWEALLRSLGDGQYLCEHRFGSFMHVSDKQVCDWPDDGPRSVTGPMTAEIRKKAVEMGLM